jgi:hypothetical protein
MAELTKQALIVENNTNFPNNNTGFITPALLREFNTDMIDSTVNQTRYNADSASWNAELNALDPSGSAASIVALNQFTASIQGTNAFTASATISINALNAFTSSVTATATGSLLTTASFSGNTMTFTKGDGSTFGVVIPDVSGSTTTALNEATASLQAFTASVAGTNAFTASIAGTNAFTQSAQQSINALNSASSSYAISSSVAAVDKVQTDSINAINSFTASNGISSLNSFTASIYNTNPWTASINTWTSSTNARLNSIEATTASLQNQINLISGSGTAISVDALNAFTASIQQTNAFTASAKLEFAALEAFTASVAGTNAFTQSAQNSLNSLNAATSSYITSAVTSSMAVSSSLYAVTSSLSRNVVVTATNDNQSTLPVGTVVRITGATGDVARFNTASYDSEVNSSNTLGVLNHTAASGAPADITVIGVVTGINTDGMTAGDLLYLGANGTFTNVQPQAPLNIVTLGEVLRVQLNNGSMFVNVSNGWELNELHNVRIVNPLQGDVLVYEASSSLWKNQPSSSVTPTDISALNAFTASVAGTNAFTASIAGTNAFTASALTTASVNLNTITFTKGNGSTFNITVNTGSGGGGDTAALNAFTASVAGTNTFTASIAGTNTFTQSAQLEINSLEAFTASIAGTNAFTASALTTASFSGNTLTFTKGNGTTFGVLIPDVSGSGAAFPFTGSAQITGSLQVFGPSITTGSIISKGDVNQAGGYTGTVTINGNGGGIDIAGNQSYADGILLRGFPLAADAYQMRVIDNNRIRLLLAPTSGSGTSDLQQQFLIQQNGPGRTGVYNRTFTKVGYANENFGYPNNIIISSSVGTNTDQRNFIGFGNITNPTDAPAGGWNFLFASANDALGGAKTRIDGHLYVSQSFTGALQSGFAWVGDGNGYSRAVATSSFAGTPTDISALNAFTASVAGTNTFTQSAQLEINALEAFTASIASTNAFTASATLRLNSLESTSASVNTSLASLNAFTASAQLEINALEVFSGSALTTASFSGNTLTFTKGNGTTFGVTIPDVSGSTINTGSFATTGSNAFFGNQTISGSLGISGSAITFVSGTLSGSVVTNIGDTFTDVAPVNRIITLTSASYAALASGSLTDPNALYIVSGSTSGSIAGAALIGNNTFSGSNVYTGSVQGNVVAMSIASNTASMDFNAGNFFTLTLVSGSIPTFINPTNIKAGQTVSLVVTQASVLSGSLAFPTTFKFPYGSAYTASVTASAVDVITFMTVNTSTIYASSVKNLV